MLTRLQRERTTRGNRRRCRVSSDKDVRNYWRAQRSIYADPSQIVVRSRDQRGEGRGAHTGRQHHGVETEGRAVRHRNSIASKRSDADAEMEYDARACQSAFDDWPGTRAQLWSHDRGAIQEMD